MRILSITLLSFSLIAAEYKPLSGVYKELYYGSNSYLEFKPVESILRIKFGGKAVERYVYEETEKTVVIYKIRSTCRYDKKDLGTKIVLVIDEESSVKTTTCLYQYTLAKG
tara:strand:- start:950 stop:1282 length:333 start_codon:yes stop_codon:yes gene_type:complete